MHSFGLEMLKAILPPLPRNAIQKFFGGRLGGFKIDLRPCPRVGAGLREHRLVIQSFYRGLGVRLPNGYFMA